MKPLSPTKAARLAGWEGEAHNLRRSMIRYVDRRERALGIALWVRDADGGNRRITEATLRTHCPELFESSIDELRADIQLSIERLESRLVEVVDERIAGPVQQLRRENRRTLEAVSNLANVTGNRFQRVESRIAALEQNNRPDRTRP